VNGPVWSRVLRRCGLGAVALLWGCVATPEKQALAPPSAGPAEFGKSVADLRSGAAFRSGDWPADQWWRGFGDARLDRLIEEALTHNPGMAVAEARVRLAREAANYARAATGPSLDLNASVTREHFSKHDLIPPEFSGTTVSVGRATLDFSYDFDLWNRNRHVWQARLGEADATAAEQAQARLILSTAVAGAYAGLQSDQARLALAKEALAWRAEQLSLAQSRFRRGLGDADAVQQARALAEFAQQAVTEMEQRVTLDATALSNLVGRGPDRAMEVASPSMRVDETFPLPQRLDLDLLGRRPDVVALRKRVEAAAQEVGAARADFYPNLNLLALIGLQSVDLSQWLTAGSAIAALGPALHLPLFDGGGRRATLNARHAEYDIAVGQYNQAVLDATREVVDRLVDLQALRERRAQQQSALRAKTESYRLAQSRYRHGLIDYAGVLNAGQDVLEQRNAAIGLEEGRIQATLGLIRALGGGYRAPSTEEEKSLF
jgi:NodT family efflux transporter outer membrane factor (OMF) lipoprotein